MRIEITVLIFIISNFIVLLCYGNTDSFNYFYCNFMFLI